MTTATKIEWADVSTNIGVGCSHCSPGCDHCYAEKFAHRLSKHPIAKKVYAGVVDEQGRWTGKINFNLSDEVYPHRVPGKSKRVFVGSMTDIFHPNYPAENRDEIFASIMADYILANGHGHTFIILTKRPQAMEEYFAAGPETLLRRWGRAGNWIIVGDGDETFEEYADGQTIPQEMTSPRDNLRQEYLWPLPNLWLGVTVCNRDELWKLDVLREIPAALRIVSFEPLLSDLGTVDLSGIGWGIAGGETGSSARPMHPVWVCSLRDQCQCAGVPFFFKSWGEWLPTDSCDWYRGEDNIDFVLKYGRTGREFPNSEGRSIIGDGRVLLVDPPLKISNAFREKYKLPSNYKPDGRNLLIDAEARRHAHKCGLHEVGYQWMYRVGKKRAGRLLDGGEWNEVPS